MAAGTSPPRVTATMPRQGARSRRRQASALECRCSSSQLTGKVLACRIVSVIAVLSSARIDADFVAGGVGHRRRREAEAVGGEPHLGQRLDDAFDIALGR